MANNDLVWSVILQIRYFLPLFRPCKSVAIFPVKVFKVLGRLATDEFLEADILESELGTVFEIRIVYLSYNGLIF